MCRRDRDEILELDGLLREMLEVLLKLMKENTETYMPGFTHLQKAQPITLAHHMGAYFEMFKRDRSRMKDIYRRMNYCPLGSGALAGTTYPLDREYTAELLGFDGPTLNSMDAVAYTHLDVYKRQIMLRATRSTVQTCSVCRFRLQQKVKRLSLLF